MIDDIPEIPARMLNEWTYCPRLAWLEWIDREWADTADTVHGRRMHARVDRKDDDMVRPDEIPAEGEVMSRGVMLSSAEDGIIARFDLVESADGKARPVDYKRSTQPDIPGGVWPPERIQIGAQVLVLRANGYACDEGAIYFAGSKRRVLIPAGAALIDDTLAAAEAFRVAVRAEVRPPPLVDSPKCVRCSLAPICLPDETTSLGGAAQLEDVRRLCPARDDACPLHVSEPGARIGKSGEELVIKKSREELGRAPIPGTSAVSIYGRVQVTTQAVHALMERGIPLAFFSGGGWLKGIAAPSSSLGFPIRRAQHRASDDPARSAEIVRTIVRSKIRNQRVILRRNHPDAPRTALDAMRRAATRCARSDAIDTLRGYEGEAAAVYFEHFGALIRPHEDMDWSAAWSKRTRRPPTDPINACLGFAYAVLVREWDTAIRRIGLDPALGFLHVPRPGRPSLALDLMEPFRPIVADSAVITAFNNKELAPDDFVYAGPACNLNARGRRAFLRTLERRLDQLVTHPVFGYRISYRRVFEVQTRLFARWLTGELETWPPFEVR